MQSPLQVALGLMEEGIELPTIPEVVLRIAGKLNEEETSIAEVIDLLFQDQVLTARVLRLVNTPLFSPMKHVTDLREGLIYLGLDRLKEMIFTCAIIDLFRTGERTFNRSALWLHALGVGTVARMVAEKVEGVASSDAYIAGLLHDVGEVYLSFFRADEFIRITKAVHDETISFHDAEYRLLGTSHCEVGYLIGQGWHFAPPINDAILHHHDPDAAPPENAALVAVVAIANQYNTLRRLGYGNPRPTREDLDGSGWWETLRQSLPGTRIDPNRIIMELDGSIAQIRSAIENTYI